MSLTSLPPLPPDTKADPIALSSKSVGHLEILDQSHIFAARGSALFIPRRLDRNLFWTGRCLLSNSD